MPVPMRVGTARPVPIAPLHHRLMNGEISPCARGRRIGVSAVTTTKAVTTHHVNASITHQPDASTQHLEHHPNRRWPDKHSVARHTTVTRTPRGRR